MPLTVAQVAALPDLGLVVRTSGAPLDREVRWVAVSEHADPTPWIEAGDLVLTTGMSLSGRATDARAYVHRLVGADVAGLGFGFGAGLSHPAVPPTLIAAAERAGLPLLEVPEPVPFVAVSKAVSRLLTEEEYAETAASFECQRQLIRAVLADSEQSVGGVVVHVLARHVRGFALHLDATGDLLAGYPESDRGRALELSDEIDRLRPRGVLASASLATADEHIVIVPIGARGSAEGFLVVGSSRPLRPADQSALNLAVSLLSWDASRPVARDAGMDPWRRVLLALADGCGLDPALLGDVGLAALDPRRAVAVEMRGVPGQPVPDAVLARAHGIPGVVLARQSDGSAAGFAPAADDGGPLPALAVLADLPGVRVLGSSNPLDLTEAGNVRQARDQATRAAALGGGLRRIGDGPAPSLGALLDAATTTTWAVEYLGGLLAAAEGDELMDTLQAWLGQHGQVDAAAHRLGVHRHTVRHRLRRAEVVLGRSLDDPGVRADLWFALRSVRPDGR
jgi:purine catabolism regulator